MRWEGSEKSTSQKRRRREKESVEGRKVESGGCGTTWRGEGSTIAGRCGPKSISGSQNTSLSDRFWKLSCRKMHLAVARSIFSKSKRQKHLRFRALLCDKLCKKCARLRCKAHCEAKMFKTSQIRSLLAVEMFKKRTPMRREAHREIKRSKTTILASGNFWKLRCQKSARHCGAKRFRKSKVLKAEGLGLRFEVRISARDSAPCQK